VLTGNRFLAGVLQHSPAAVTSIMQADFPGYAKG
jgi:hypothetical protein